jgi:hypothetical protein
MCSTHALPRRRAGVAAVVTGLVFTSAFALGEPPGGKRPNADAKRAAELVDAIVNRNKEPKVVKWRSQWPFPRKAALFREDHDWKEEARVRKALYRLEKERTEAVWEELVKRSGDRRYCETVTSQKTGDAYIYSVGYVCRELAYARLIGVFWQHLPLDPIRDGQHLRLDVGIRDLAKWRKQRAAKSLYELQIEVCEKAIKALADVEGVPRAEKDRARKKIKEEIARLKKTGRPVQVQGAEWFEERGVYDAKLARRVREGVKSGKYDNLGIIK